MLKGNAENINFEIRAHYCKNIYYYKLFSGRDQSWWLLNARDTSSFIVTILKGRRKEVDLILSRRTWFNQPI